MEIWSNNIEEGGRVFLLNRSIFPKMWELIDKFKECCRLKGWSTFDNEDLIKAENEYHRLIWVNHLHINTFKRVVLNHLWNLHAIREGVSYRTVRLSYMAWILPETPSESILQTFEESQTLSRKVALYDLSRAYEAHYTCMRKNETESAVLREFEQFLNTEYGIGLEPFSKSRTISRLPVFPRQGITTPKIEWKEVVSEKIC